MEATGAWQMSADFTEPLPMPGVDIHLHFNLISDYAHTVFQYKCV